MTATQDPPSVPGEERSTIEVHPIDPLRDVDAKKTALWLAVGTTGILISLYLLFQVFVVATEMVREDKIDNAPTAELDALRDAEQKGAAVAGPYKVGPNNMVEHPAIGEPSTDILGDDHPQLREAMRRYAK